MFGTKHNECVGFESKWKVKKVSSENSSQTAQCDDKEKSSNTIEKRSTEVQTESAEIGLKQTPDVDMGKLAKWLAKIYPNVKKEINNANHSRAFMGYRLLRDKSDANCMLLQTQSIFKSDEDDEKATKISLLTWNQTGKSIALTNSYEHTSWCYHFGQVLIYTLDKNERIPDAPRTKLIVEGCIVSLKFHPVHPAILAAGTFAGNIIIWNAQNEDGNNLITNVNAHEELVTQLSWIADVNSSNVTLLASSSIEGFLKLWTFNSANGTLTIKAKYKIKPPILGTIRRNRETPEHIAKKQNRGVLCFDFSKHKPDLFVVGVEGGLVVQCSLLGATKLKGSTDEEPLLDPTFKYYDPHEGEVKSVSITPNRDDMFMTSGTDSEIRVYLFGQEDPARVIFMKDPLHDLMFIPHQEKLVAGCGASGVLEIFHLITGQPVQKIIKDNIQKHKQVLTSLAINNNKTTLIAMGTAHGDLQLWHVPWQEFTRDI